MKTNRVRLFISLCIVLVLSLSIMPKAMAQEPVKLKIGFSTWVGYGPLFVAQDKGYLTDAGLDVEFVKVEDPKDRFVALAGKQLDGLVTTLDTASQYWNTEAPFKIFLGLDESSGGDGIVVNSGIASIADLKGKKIGVNVGSVSQFFLEYILKQNGMTDSDVTLVKMQQGDVPAALASNSIDAGVTWEPHLSKAVQNGATLLVSSKETPGLIVDILLLRSDVMDANPDAAAGLVGAWYKAVDYWKANPDDADTIMAKGLGGFYETADDIKADLAGATLFDEEHNQKFFSGAADEPGSAVATLQFAIDFYTQLGIITNPVKAEDLLDPSVVLPEGTPEATPEATP